MFSPPETPEFYCSGRRSRSLEFGAVESHGDWPVQGKASQGDFYNNIYYIHRDIYIKVLYINTCGL